MNPVRWLDRFGIWRRSAAASDSEGDTGPRGSRDAPRPALLLGARLIALVLIALAGLWINWILDFSNVKSLRTATRRAEDDIAQQNLNVEQLREEVKRLHEGVDGVRLDEVERIAREDLGMVAPGEVLFVIPDTAGSPTE
jgi:cell division protein FtsB